VAIPHRALTAQCVAEHANPPGGCDLNHRIEQVGEGAEDLPFRQVAQNLPSLCWISDAEGRIVWVNDAWVRYTGLDVAAIAAQGLEPLHAPEVYPQVVARWAQVKAAGEAGEMIFPLKGRDGGFRPFHAQVVPLRDREGRVVRWFGTNTDVSAHSEAQAKLATQGEELQELFEQAGDGIFISDEASRYQRVNPAACALLGYTREELLTLSVADLVDPADMARAQSVRTHATDRAITGDWRLKRKDDSWIDVEISARVLSDGRRLALVRDISERLRKAEALEAERRSLARQVDEEAARAEAAEQIRRQFWEASRDLMAVFALDSSRPLMLNAHAWFDTLGYSAEELAKIQVMDLVHPDDRAAVLALRKVLDVKGVHFGLENRYRAKDGSWVWLSWNIVRSGERSFCIGRNITEERARSEYAERAQRLEALGQLTGGVAHDFNNLLTTILGAIDLMQRRPDDRALRERLMTAALAAVRRGERLTKQLLSFARREPSGARASDVRAVLSDMRPLLESALREDIGLHFELDPEITGCAIDGAQLEAAVLNLVVNARDAMPEAGIVTLRTRRPTAAEAGRYSLSDDAFAVLEVLDTGEGMPPEVLARVFEPFFTTKDLGKGSGLGLSQVYGAARQAGGVATVESEPGSGTAVRMFLKRAELPLDSPEKPRASDSEAQRVLLVEDDVLVAVVTESVLQDAGFQVTRAADAAEALAALRGGAFEVLITDVRMPGAMNGVELAKLASQRDPKLRVLLCSGWTAESLGQDLSEGRWPFLPKPFDQAQLKRALAEIAGEPASAED
jgi:PAS domain S-box-containing protein